MSVLIKGMEMPSGCETCKLKYRHQGAYVVDYCFPYMKCVDPWTFGEKRNGDKPEWCPLVELPPHGRLIDADTILDNVMKAMRHFNYDETRVLTLASVMQMTETAPSIIEAEEVKE